jgi:hypothetical protein
MKKFLTWALNTILVFGTGRRSGEAVVQLYGGYQVNRGF